MAAARACASCNLLRERDEFSNRQWRKAVGKSRCALCIAGLSDDGGAPTARVNDGASAHFEAEDIESPFEAGSFHYVAKGVFTSGPRDGEPCVAKWPLDGHTSDEDDLKDDVRCSKKAMEIVREFNAQGIIDTHVSVNIPEIRAFEQETGFGGLLYLLEAYIENYEKWNNNGGWKDDDSDFGRAMQALSHFSYHKTGGNMLLCDIQGGVSEGEGAVLTDPIILSQAQTYGETDYGTAGIIDFFESHVCNEYCDKDWMFPAQVERTWIDGEPDDDSGTDGTTDNDTTDGHTTDGHDTEDGTTDDGTYYYADSDAEDGTVGVRAVTRAGALPTRRAPAEETDEETDGSDSETDDETDDETDGSTDAEDETDSDEAVVEGQYYVDEYGNYYYYE